MNCIEIEKFGLGELRYKERDDVVAGAGQMVVRLKAASLNFRDLRMVKGEYNPKQRLPLIPGSDGVGVVESLGAGVSEWKVGDRVMPCFAPLFASGEPSTEKIRPALGAAYDGTFSQKIVIPAAGAVAAPEYLNDAACAALPCAAVTAWNALVEQGPLQPGDFVLVQGTGGVSLFALQIARLFGARVIATSSSDEKLERAKKLGAEFTINYKNDPQWGRTAKKLTGGRGVDVVVEVGGGGTLEQSLSAIRIGGRIMVIGVLSGTKSELQLTNLLMNDVRLQGVFVGSREMFENMLRAFVASKVAPVVDKQFALPEARAAFEYLESGAHFGKVVLDIA